MVMNGSHGSIVMMQFKKKILVMVRFESITSLVHVPNNVDIKNLTVEISTETFSLPHSVTV